MKRLPLKEAALATNLKGNNSNFEIEWYDSHPSTNKRARELGSTGMRKPYVIVADSQTEGRGRLGRTWYSPENSGLWFSILCFPQMPLHKVTALTIKTGKAVQRFLSNEFHIESAIKYPNDLLVGKKKICGILAESDTIAGRTIPEYVVIGTGLNLNTVIPDDLKNICTSVNDHWQGDFKSNDELIATVVYEIMKECELNIQE